jgi:hypothetical protein
MIKTILLVCLAGLMLTGCGASVQTMNLIGTDTSTYINETLPSYIAQNPGDAVNAKQNASNLTNDVIAGEIEAASLPTTAQIAADGQAIVQLLEELAQLIPIIEPLVAAKANGATLTPKEQSQVDYFYQLNDRIRVIRSHYPKK